MNADILRRVIELPYEFATNLLTGLPVQGVLFKPAKWKEQVSVYMGLPPTSSGNSQVCEPAYHHQRRYQRKSRLACQQLTEFSLRHWWRDSTSLNHNTILGNVEVGLHDAGVPFKSTGSTNGQGTKDTFRRQLPETPSGSSLEKTNKIIPDLVIRASH